MKEKLALTVLNKDYSEEPWDPFWEYELHWSGDFTEVYIISPEN